MATSAPVIDEDLYGAPALRDSRALFARIRDAGPVVWLPRHRMFAIGRYEDVKAALRDDEVLVSGRGVAANPVTNLLARDTTLFSDGATHDARRKVLRESLNPKALKAIEGHVEQQARRVVAELGLGREFDAAGAFSRHVPVNVVADLVGVRGGADRLLRWAGGVVQRARPGQLRAPRRPARPRWACCCTCCGSGLDASPRAAGRPRSSPRATAARSAPARRAPWSSTSSRRRWIPRSSRLRTCSGTSRTTPTSTPRVRADPTLVPAAVVESVRLGAPIRGFTRCGGP